MLFLWQSRKAKGARSRPYKVSRERREIGANQRAVQPKRPNKISVPFKARDRNEPACHSPQETEANERATPEQRPKKTSEPLLSSDRSRIASQWYPETRQPERAINKKRPELPSVPSAWSAQTIQACPVSQRDRPNGASLSRTVTTSMKRA